MDIEFNKRMRRMLNFLIGNIHLNMLKYPDQAKELAEIISIINCEHEFENWSVKEDPICKKCGLCVSDLPREVTLVSNCCGAVAGDYEEYGICPKCKEHCEWEPTDNG